MSILEHEKNEIKGKIKTSLVGRVKKKVVAR